MNETFISTSDYSRRKWYVIDCKGKQLGRISSSIVGLLTGKIKPSYHPALDSGDYVVLINAEHISFDREIERFYVFRPGRPGKALKKLINAMPQRIIENCIYKMMPNGTPKRNLAQRLKIYHGSEHPHQAQNPIFIDEIETYNYNQ